MGTADLGPDVEMVKEPTKEELDFFKLVDRLLAQLQHHDPQYIEDACGCVVGCWWCKALRESFDEVLCSDLLHRGAHEILEQAERCIAGNPGRWSSPCRGTSRNAEHIVHEILHSPALDLLALIQEEEEWFGESEIIAKACARLPAGEVQQLVRGQDASAAASADPDLPGRFLERVDRIRLGRLLDSYNRLNPHDTHSLVKWVVRELDKWDGLLAALKSYATEFEPRKQAYDALTSLLGDRRTWIKINRAVGDAARVSMVLNVWVLGPVVSHEGQNNVPETG